MMRFIRFSIAGASGFVVQIAAFALLVHLAGLHYLVATAIAVELAILANFVWHEQWTWKDRALGASGAIRRLIRFNALTAATSIAGGVVVAAFLVETLAISPLIANIASVIMLSVINFAGADRLVFRSGVLLVALSLSGTAHAGPDSLEATLQAKTIQGFANYVAAVEARRAGEIAAGTPFLEMERRAPAEQARIMASLRRGEIFVERGAAARDQASNEIPIDGGLINHWRGTVFVPKVKLDDLLKVLQEPQTDKHKQEEVLSSRVVSRVVSSDRESLKVYLRLRRTKFVTVVYDSEHDVDYIRLAPDRAYSNSISSKIVEIENAGTPRERALPEGNDHGYMWRLNSYWRYKTFEDGVLVEIESLTLSRDLPPIIGALMRPIVTSTARESMTRTLASVRARFQ